MKNKLFFTAVLLFFLTAVGLFFGLYRIKPRAEKYSDRENTLKIGVSIYNGNDTYISGVKEHMEEAAKKYEKENKVKIRMDFFDAKESQSLQNKELSKFISLGYDVLAVNMVDRTEASSLIDKAMQADIPIVFFNREPVREDLLKWDKSYYVGYDASLSAKLQAGIILDMYEKNPESIDTDGDGIVQYIMLEGESRHQDSLIRTEKSIRTLKQGGIQLEKLAGDIADWRRTQASALMSNYIPKFGSQIELVICNNDDMALGVIDELERSGIKFHNIVGIDATPQGKEAVAAGKMLGTIDISSRQLGETVFEMSRILAEKKSPEDELDLTEGTYVWLDQKTVLSEHLK